jgi:hypothetical protein
VTQIGHVEMPLRPPAFSEFALIDSMARRYTPPHEAPRRPRSTLDMSSYRSAMQATPRQPFARESWADLSARLLIRCTGALGSQTICKIHLARLSAHLFLR